ncbi:MAG: VTT domain-containing protein [Gammaproteobacteria bacterium]|nr:VTT domain-containing protein [Gammaproteobacteria bacterium]MDH4255243.1 VTT domain-containing protein [Gammaproteobacteria bacterium]MDH5310054.1 VTT domain-containing protein [Gammaproteobacteria bacterium]
MAIRDALQRRFLVVGALIILVGLVAASDTLHDRSAEIIVWTKALVERAPVAGLAAFVLLAMLSAMVAFFSSALLAPIAIYAWGEGWTLALLWFGWLLGGILSFCIGRYFGRSVVATILGEDKIAGWQEQLGERARFPHILLFQAVVPSEIPGYVLGVLRYRFRIYLAALALTELPYAAATVYLGSSFLAGNGAVFMVAGCAVLLFAVVALRLHRRYYG